MTSDRTIYLGTAGRLGDSGWVVMVYGLPGSASACARGRTRQLAESIARDLVSSLPDVPDDFDLLTFTAD